MSDGTQRRVVSIWFPRFAADLALRRRPVEGPFALSWQQNSAERIYCLNRAAIRAGLETGMTCADARAFCPDLQSRAADPPGDARFLHILRRWSTRYCPWVGMEGRDGLVLDITGAAHLLGGETALLADLRARCARAGLGARLGLGDTRGAAWALARYQEGRAAPGQALAALQDVPVAGLRLPEKTVTGLGRLGLRTIGALEATARAPLARRFGPEVLLRLDQALGRQSEALAPLAEPPHYGVRMTLPEPIGLSDDVMAGTARLLQRLCEKLKDQEVGARVLCLGLRRVDREAQEVELRLARPLRDAGRILPLFERGVAKVDAGFGIDQLRLEAIEVEPLPAEQITSHRQNRAGQLEDLISRIGTRIGLENIQRFLPADSHIPERGFLLAPAAYSAADSAWAPLRPRPIRFFAPEPIAGTSRRPPRKFRWRRMVLTTARAEGPERIAPEWWMADAAWRNGVRDYWRVETYEGRRLWLYYTPQNPGWCVQGEFA